MSSACPFHHLIPSNCMTYTSLSHTIKVSIQTRAFVIHTNFRPIVPNNKQKILISVNQRTKPGSSLLILLCWLPAYSDSLRLPSIICVCAFQLSTCSNKVLHLKARHSEHVMEKSWERLCFITLLVCVCVFKLEGSYTHSTWVLSGINKVKVSFSPPVWFFRDIVSIVEK